MESSREHVRGESAFIIAWRAIYHERQRETISIGAFLDGK